MGHTSKCSFIAYNLKKYLSFTIIIVIYFCSVLRDIQMYSHGCIHTSIGLIQISKSKALTCKRSDVLKCSKSENEKMSIQIGLKSSQSFWNVPPKCFNIMLNKNKAILILMNSGFLLFESLFENWVAAKNWTEFFNDMFAQHVFYCPEKSWRMDFIFARLFRLKLKLHGSMGYQSEDSLFFRSIQCVYSIPMLFKFITVWYNKMTAQGRISFNPRLGAI